MSTVLYYYY